MLDAHVFSTFSNLITDGAVGESTPLAVAFSGGGDSTALLHFACHWAKDNGNRPVFALIVDHGLRDNSAKEAIIAAGRAENMGAQAVILNWEGPKPKTEIQEKARQARYTLMGDMCRTLGMSQLLLGHTADDQAETLFMRAEKHSGWRGYAGMWPRKQASLWPALYGVDIVRPLLGQFRRELRGYNHDNGLDYIDDPSNENPKFARVRARTELAKLPDVTAQFLKVSTESQKCLLEERARIKNFVDRHVCIHDWGGISLDKGQLSICDFPVSELVKYLIFAVSGRAQALPRAKCEAMGARIAHPEFRGATLGGARIVPLNNKLFIVRDGGDVLGRKQKTAQQALPISVRTRSTLWPYSIIWDGRFLLHAKTPGLSVAPLMSYVEQLEASQKQVLKTTPEFARAGLPCIVQNDVVEEAFPPKIGEIVQMECLIEAHLRAILT